jgi:hypothetical protein
MPKNSGHIEDTTESYCYKSLIIGAPYRIRTGVTALRGPCPRPLDEGSSEGSLGDLRPRGLVVYVRIFLTQAEPIFFERTLDANHACGDSSPRAPGLAPLHIAQCPEGPVPIEGRGLPGVLGGRSGARFASGPDAQGLRRGDQCAARGGAAAVP